MGGKSFFHNKLFRSIMFVFLVLLFSTIALYPKTAQATSLAWNTFLGGNSQHLGYGVTTDSSGNVYAVGLTNVNWNTGMFGAPKDSIGYQGGATDGVVAKLDSTGHVLWYRILGGSINDALVNVKVDASGNVYVIGYAFGAYTFTPQATPSPVHGYVGGDIDAFVAKLDSNGNLLWHTYLGSTSNDYPWGLSVDADGNVYVGGESYRVWHADFNNVIGTNKSSDGYQGYLVKLNSSGTYQWHRFLTTYAVYEVDASLSGYVHTVKKGLYYSGGWNYPAEVGKYNTTTGEQIWNTTVGSSTQDSFGIDVDTSGNVFISGSSTATWGTPIRAHAGSTDIYAAKLNSSGTLQWNTFLGSAGTDVGRSNQPGGISVDAGGNVYTMGYSSATWGTPITAHAGGSSDGFAVMLNPSGVLVWNTFLGGTNMDTMVALSASAGGDVFVSGYTQQNSWGTPVNFPTGCYYCQSVAKISNSSTLTAIKAGAGAGSVSSAPTGISCGDDCTENFSAGTSITLTATPDEGSSFAGWSGGTCSGTDPCTFSMGDSVGITATFNVSNTAPVATPQSPTTDEDIAKAITLAGTDADEDELTYTVVTEPSHGVLTGTAPDLTYTPTANYHGADSFTFKVNDGTVDSEDATVSITVNSVNDDPAMVARSDFSVIEGATISLTGTCSDVETDDTLTVTVTQFSGTSCGVIGGTPDVGSGGSVAAAATCTAPNVSINSDLVFRVRCSDGTANNDDNIIVSVNAAPTANAQAVSADEDIAEDITLTGSDPSEAITYTIVALPENGELSGTAPNLTYTPDAHYHGADSFTFKVNDGLQDSPVATVSITVTDINDLPWAEPMDDYGVIEYEPITLQGMCHDSDVDNTLTVSIMQTSGTSCGELADATVSDTGGFVEVITDCEGPAITENTELVFRVRCDDGTHQDDAFFTVTANSAPVAIDASYATDQDTPMEITLEGTDASEPIDYDLMTIPEHGTLFGLSELHYRYTPDPGYYGTDTFTFVVFDGLQSSTTGLISITVDKANVPPEIVDDEEMEIECDDDDCALPDFTIDDPDEDDDITGGWRQVDGQSELVFTNNQIDFDYHPARGTYILQYVVSDGEAEVTSNPITITIPNNPPVLDEENIDVPDAYCLDTEYVFESFIQNPLVNAVFTDYDNDVLNYIWSADIDHPDLIDLSSCDSDSCDMVIRMAGTIILTITTDDGYGGTTTQEVVLYLPPPTLSVDDVNLVLTDTQYQNANTVNVTGTLQSPVWPVIIFNGSIEALVNLIQVASPSINDVKSLEELGNSKTALLENNTLDTYEFTASGITLNSAGELLTAKVYTSVDGENIEIASDIPSLLVDDGGTDEQTDSPDLALGANWGCSLNTGTNTVHNGFYLFTLFMGLLYMIKRITPKKKIALLLIMLFCSLGANADSADRFSVVSAQPVADAGPFFTVLDSATLDQLQWSAGRSFAFSHQPLTGSQGANQINIVEDTVYENIFGAIGLTDRLAFSADIPIVWYHNITNPDSLITTPHDAGLGDMVLTTKIHLLDQNNSPFGFSLAPFITLPSGDENAFMGEDGITGGIRAILDGMFGSRFIWSLNAGTWLREQYNAYGLNFDDQFMLSAGLGYKIHKDVTVLGELDLRTPFDEFLASKDVTPFESRAGVQWRFGPQNRIVLNMAGTFGITYGSGSPHYGALLSVAYVSPAKHITD